MFSSLRRSPARLTRLLLTLSVGVVAHTAEAQSGTVVFNGPSNNVAPTVNLGGGPALTFSSRIMSGFGATAASGSALWFGGGYSGQGMVYGSINTAGAVLELAFTAASGLNLFLTGSLFGGYENRSAFVTYRLFNDDYSQSTSAATVTTGTNLPANPSFSHAAWGNVVRLQFVETNSTGANLTNAINVGTQNITYRVEAPSTQPPSTTVPEPSTYLLMASGLAAIAMVSRRRSREQRIV